MPKSLRLTEAEQELLRNKSVEINKLLIKAGKEPIKDSELAHQILTKGAECVRVKLSGEIYFEAE